MKDKFLLPYALDNRINNIKAFFWAVGVLLAISLIFVLGVWIGLPLSSLLIFLLTKGLDKKDGTLEIIQYDTQRGIALLKQKKTNLIEEKPFKNKTFSWHYVHTPMGKGGTTNGTTHVNNIGLKLTCFLADGKKVGFIESLYPWQEIPKDWEYELFIESTYDEIKFVSNLENFKTKIEE